MQRNLVTIIEKVSTRDHYSSTRKRVLTQDLGLETAQLDAGTRRYHAAPESQPGCASAKNLTKVCATKAARM